MMSSKLAVQMYTIRDFLHTAKDLEESLRKIRDIGYPAVQISAVKAMSGDSPEVSAAQAKKMLDDNGLKCIATHVGWDSLANNTEKEIEFHKTLGCDYTAIGSIPGAWGDNAYGSDGADGYRRFVHDALPVIEKLKAAGIRFGYHNHAFEFARTTPENYGKDPKTLFDIFIEEGGADLMLELDLYWIDHAGVNPEKTLARSKGRVPVIHIKDKEMAGNDPVMAPIGEGNLDWDGLIPACEAAGVDWYCVEQDVCRRDPFDCLKSSFNYLSNKMTQLGVK
jgi:sugar phosphate isomerase/epimerase